MLHRVLQGADGGGFSRSVGADKTENLALFHRKTQVDNASGLAVALGQMLDFDNAHEGTPFGQLKAAANPTSIILPKLSWRSSLVVSSWVTKWSLTVRTVNARTP
jgi:hypothetical protein